MTFIPTYFICFAIINGILNFNLQLLMANIHIYIYFFFCIKQSPALFIRQLTSSSKFYGVSLGIGT